MAHKFNPKNKDVLKSKEREKHLPPDELLRKAGLRKQDVFIDIGCGVGHFSVPALEIVGSQGMVLAVDTSSEMIEDLSSAVDHQNAEQLTTVLSDEYDFLIQSDFGDILLMSSVLHEVDNPSRFLLEGKRVLKSKGRIIIVDWVKEEMEEGPPVHHRISLEESEKLLKSAGYNLLSREKLNDRYYMVIAEKP